MGHSRLFNEKTIKRYLKSDPIPAEHFSILNEWSEFIKSGRILSLKETSLQGQFANKIVETVLGYRGPVEQSGYTLSTEQSILKGNVDLALGHFGEKVPKIIAPFELKGARTRDLDAIMPGRNKSPVQQAWEYAMHARGVKWVIVCNYVELRFYGFGEGTNSYEVFDLENLTDPTEYARFMLVLSAENLLSGQTTKLLKESRQEDKDITDNLYSDYKALRVKLIDAVKIDNETIEPIDAIAVAQKILDRVLFIAFSEDTGLLPSNTLAAAFEARDPYNPRPIWENFKGLFSAIDKGSQELKIPRYNGGLFRSDPDIDKLELQDEICKGFKTLGDYDFASEVSVTVLGHIFEQSISDIERLQAIARGEEQEPEKASGTSGRRKRDGVVYTPDYIARFIVAETLGAHLREIFEGILRDHAKKGADISDYAAIPWRRKSAELEAWQAYRDRLRTLRIVDPACGSGVFLIMAFDFLKAELSRVSNKIGVLEGKIGSFAKSDTEDLFDPDSEILSNNLYGVDVNAESVEITKLSLWITTARRGKVLDSLSGSIRVGDSLIEDSNFAYLDHAFTWETAFPEVFAEGGFDVVLGNPPYVRMEFLKTLKPYLEKRYEVVSDRADLYCYFFERGLRLLKPGGRLGYISSNTFFKIGSGTPLREYLLKEATIESVIDFGDLQVFEGVTTYPAILTMKRGTAPKEHELRFWKVDSLPENNFLAAWEAAAGPYPHTALGAESWELENSALRALREKIRLGKNTLTETYGTLMRGVSTGCNEAFMIDTPTKERLCAEAPKSADLLKPFLQGKDLRRWSAESRGLWLILIPKGWTKERYHEQTEEVAWKKFSENYPAIAGQLAPSAINARKRTDQGDYWWELRACSYYDVFFKPKIVSTKISHQPTFSIENTGSVLSNTAYMFDAGEDSQLILAILNSTLGNFFFKSVFVVKSGGYYEIQPGGLGMFPIPSVDSQSQSKIKDLVQSVTFFVNTRKHLQTALTRRIPDLCPPEREPELKTKLKEWWTLPDFAAFRSEVKKAFKVDIPLAERSDWEDWINRDRAEIARLTAEIAQAEATIDCIVYDLFDLTPEEIVLLEASVGS